MTALIAMAALVDDLLSARGLAGGAMLSEAMRRWVARRLESVPKPSSLLVVCARMPSTK